MRYVIAFSILIGLFCSDSVMGAGLVRRVYDNQGKIIQTEVEIIIKDEPVRFKSDDEVRSAELWPAWKIDFCPYLVRAFDKWIDRDCLICHNEDRTRK